MKRLLFILLLAALSAPAIAQNLNANTRTIRFAGVPSGPCSVFMLGVNNSANTEYNCGTDGAWHQIGAAVGTVTSVSFTGGLISVATPTAAAALTVAGTSGGIPYFASTSTWASSALLAANGVVLGGGAGTTPATNAALTFASNVLGITDTAANTDLTVKNTTAAIVGTSQGSPLQALCGRAFHGSADVEDCLTLKELPGNGNDATITFTLGHTGTSTGNVIFNAPLMKIPGGGSTLGYGWQSNSDVIWDSSLGGGPITLSVNNGHNILSVQDAIAKLGSNIALSFTSTSNDSTATADVGMSRGGPGIIDFGTGAAASVAGFIKSAHTVSLSADWTCGTGGTVASCVSAQIIGSTATPLTFTLPLVAANWSFDCELVVGQATAATANSWNLLTATNGVTSTTSAYQMNTAATAMAGGATTDTASTTTTFLIGPSWTLGGTATKMPVHIWGTLTGVSASGTVVSLQLVAPTVGDLVTLYEGSKCSVNP